MADSPPSDGSRRVMFLLRRYLRHASQQSILTQRSFGHSLSCHSKKLEAIATYEQLVHEHAPLISYLEGLTAHDPLLRPHAEPSSEDAGARNYKGTRNFRIALEHFRTLKATYEDTVQLFDSPELVDLAIVETDTLISDLRFLLKHDLPTALLPSSETEELSALVELKAGVGGSESSLFVAELLRMYSRFSRQNEWEPTVLSSSEGDSGGFKDAILEIKGTGAYDALRWESGVHRVQRVPTTEASGRVHTSTVAAVVLPLSDESRMNGADDLVKPEDVRVEVMRARGAGGQHVNKTESAVRLTHLPTGITVSMQDERSQHQNKRRAYQILRARLMDLKLVRDQAERRAVRKSLVRTADRGEKIRTYNYQQNRVTDHRLGKGSMVSCEAIMEGVGLRMLVDGLKDKHLSEALEEVLEPT
ncbi:release factor [Russula earlei]|uniref:Release factor n=1 Tax=Russula earlei TaxID=71964 RepID=A0ACC0U265_9AGAM|nr:release factor [Russula earlei]